MKKSYLEFIKVLDEWREDKTQRHRLALYRCTFNGCEKLVKRDHSQVKRNRILSCGCLKVYVDRTKSLGSGTGRLPRNYADKKLGQFQILEMIEKKHDDRVMWRAICLECGTIVEVDSKQIQRGNSPCRCRTSRHLHASNRKRRIQNMLADIKFYEENPDFK